MPPGPDADRDHRRIIGFWTRIERRLEWYVRHQCAARRLGFVDREGWYLLAAFVALTGLAGLASLNALAPRSWLRGAASLVAVYYVVDVFLVNTSITFVTHRPIHRLRAILLTILNVLNIGMAFAVLYASERWCFSGTAPLSWVDAMYFSFSTLTTLGYGDIVPDRGRACGWVAQLTVVAQAMTSVYFLAVVVTTVASWTHRPDEGEA